MNPTLEFVRAEVTYRREGVRSGFAYGVRLHSRFSSFERAFDAYSGTPFIAWIDGERWQIFSRYARRV